MIEFYHMIIFPLGIRQCTQSYSFCIFDTLMYGIVFFTLPKGSLRFLQFIPCWHIWPWGEMPQAPLILFRDGRPLSRASLTSWLRGILSAAGIQGNFSSHSFRIGAATVAPRNGIPDHQIQALGRWTSSAYLLYIHTPAESLSQLSKQLSLSAAQ